MESPDYNHYIALLKERTTGEARALVEILSHGILELEQLRKRYELALALAVVAAETALDGAGHPLGDGWFEMEWTYLEDTYPGPQEAAHLRKCWTFAVENNLIELRQENQFRIRSRQ